MSVQRFVTFEPIQGVFKKAIKPYKSWREGSDMSQKIEIDGEYYRLLRTTRIINKQRFRKVVVCTEEGHIVEDEAITRRCLRPILNITYAEKNKPDLQFLLTQGKKEQHEPMITAFKQIKARLEPILSYAENEAMAFHLHYLKEVYRIQYELSKISRTVLTNLNRFKSMSTDVYSDELMEQHVEALSVWCHLKDESEAILHEDGLRARKEVMKIMRNYEYLKKIRDIDNYFYIIDDIKGSNKVSKRFIRGSKEGRNLFKEWLDFDNGDFTIEKLIYELRHIYSLKMTIDMDVNIFMEKHWALSSNRRFK